MVKLWAGREEKRERGASGARGGLGGAGEHRASGEGGVGEWGARGWGTWGGSGVGGGRPSLGCRRVGGGGVVASDEMGAGQAWGVVAGVEGSLTTARRSPAMEKIGVGRGKMR
ncbi:hypothetical protein TIFTF001_012621 [Ficus carica]|uniref:Uncharacterized protein n=1 Tax=Ficus carica TaxID=3494 RepID=A0AA88AG96_FICCA|nr:hypothetical protein TIFTF001_012621 [Ficus carica]